MADGSEKNLGGWLFGSGVTSISSWAPAQVQPARKPGHPQTAAFGGGFNDNFGVNPKGTTFGGPSGFYGSSWKDQ